MELPDLIYEVIVELVSILIRRGWQMEQSHCGSAAQNGQFQSSSAGVGGWNATLRKNGA